MDGELTDVIIEEIEGDNHIRVRLLGPGRPFVVVFRIPLMKRKQNPDTIIYESAREAIEIEIDEPARRALITANDKKSMKSYTTTVAIAKQLKRDLYKYSLEVRQASEVATGARIGVGVEGPARQTGQLPRDPNFQPLDIGTAKHIAKYLGGKRRKTRRRKTTRSENLYRKN